MFDKLFGKFKGEQEKTLEDFSQVESEKLDAAAETPEEKTIASGFKAMTQVALASLGKFFGNK